MAGIETWTRVPVALIAALAVACGGGGDSSDTGAEMESAPAVDPATAGSVMGTIAFEGMAPAPEPIDMSEEEVCAAKHEGTPMQATVKVDGGGLADVFVYVKEGLPERSWPAAGEVLLDQDGCIYHPHVLGLQTGQTLSVRNSDGILHNINARPEMNRGFNISQPTNMTSGRSFSQAEIMIPVQCDVHGWMQAYVGVVEHPYFAVSAADGSYTIENLPAGDYVVEVWHEVYGTQTQNVTVAAQEQATADFTYSASMAGADVPLGQPIDLHDHGATIGAAGAGR